MKQYYTSKWRHFKGALFSLRIEVCLWIEKNKVTYISHEFGISSQPSQSTKWSYSINFFQLCHTHLQKSVWMCSESKLVKYRHNTLKPKQVCLDLSSYAIKTAVFYVVKNQTKEDDNSTLRNIQVIILIRPLHSSQNSTLKKNLSDITRTLWYGHDCEVRFVK